jgi:hypothetical protein
MLTTSILLAFAAAAAAAPSALQAKCVPNFQGVPVTLANGGLFWNISPSLKAGASINEAATASAVRAMLPS